MIQSLRPLQKKYVILGRFVQLLGGTPIFDAYEKVAIHGCRKDLDDNKVPEIALTGIVFA